MTITETLGPIDTTKRAPHPAYIETIVVNRDAPWNGGMWPVLDCWVSLAFDGINATLSVGEGTHNPQPPMYMTAYGARQLAVALSRLADRIDQEGRGDFNPITGGIR